MKSCVLAGATREDWLRMSSVYRNLMLLQHWARLEGYLWDKNFQTK
jgi:hypothetical protein